MDPKLFKDCLIKTEFSKQKVDNDTVYNNGKGGDLILVGEPRYESRQTAIGNPGKKLSMGVLD
jgi:hypothetical protein